MNKHRTTRLHRAIVGGLTVATLAASTLATIEPASAAGPRHRVYGNFPYRHGAVGTRYGNYGYRQGNRGLGVGAAVGLGVLGAVAAGAAASQFYNGYPVYPEGAHTGYGYDYYPDHGGYYGPY